MLSRDACSINSVVSDIQLRTFRVQMCKPHVLGKPTGLAANGTYRELYVFFVLSNLTS
jgi:hypothetical protein